MKKRLYAAIFAGLLLCGCANAADETFDDRYAASGDTVAQAAAVETGSIAIPESLPETEAVPETENTPETLPMVEPEQPVVVLETEPVTETETTPVIETEPVPVVVETEPVIETKPEPVVIETEPETTPIVETEPMPETTPETEPVPEPASVVVETEPETEPAPEIPQEVTYVLNTNTKKFHLPGCASVKRIKEKNYKAFTGTREEAIAQGYDPCKNCKP